MAGPAGLGLIHPASIQRSRISEPLRCGQRFRFFRTPFLAFTHHSRVSLPGR